MTTNTAAEKGLEDFLEEGFEIKGLAIDAGRHVLALQKWRRPANVHVDGLEESFPETTKTMEIGY